MVGRWCCCWSLEQPNTIDGMVVIRPGGSCVSRCFFSDASLCELHSLPTAVRTVCPGLSSARRFRRAGAEAEAALSGRVVSCRVVS